MAFGWFRIYPKQIITDSLIMAIKKSLPDFAGSDFLS